MFDVDPAGEAPAGTIGYQLYHRVVNKSGGPLAGVTVELGYGVGEAFTLSLADDGLGFSPAFPAPPDRDMPGSSQFPFGLFGDADCNPSFDLAGLFSSERTGYEMGSLGGHDRDGELLRHLRRSVRLVDGEAPLPEGGFWALGDAVGFDQFTIRVIATPCTIDTQSASAFSLFASPAHAAPGAGERFCIQPPIAPVPLPATAPMILLSVGLIALAKRIHGSPDQRLTSRLCGTGQFAPPHL